MFFIPSIRLVNTANTFSPNHRWRIVTSLAITTVIRTLLVIISFGCKVPAGIFVPSMAIGAAFGRMVGIAVQAMHESFPSAAFFSACEPDGPCITPGTYAFLGAAAALSGIMHITVSVVVIMFEITGALDYILPTMIVVGVTKAVSERFGHGGIADRMITLNGYPFLDTKTDTAFGVPVSTVMSTSPVCLPAHGTSLRALERTLADTPYQGYPIVSDESTKELIGYIGRTELQYALSRAQATDGASASTLASFAPPPPHSTSSPSASADLSRFIDPAPLSVHPRLPLETVMELFSKMGPRVVLIEYRGRLTGLVTVKDCLKYQLRDGHAEVGGDEGLERAWGALSGVVGWINGKCGGLPARAFGHGTGGGVRLGSPAVDRHEDVGDRNGAGSRARAGTGTGVELEERGRG
jgi:chloride channel 3/4/5